jgi:hypothetical protein
MMSASGTTRTGQDVRDLVATGSKADPGAGGQGLTAPLSRTPNKQLDSIPCCLVDWPAHSIAVTVAHTETHPVGRFII